MSSSARATNPRLKANIHVRFVASIKGKTFIIDGLKFVEKVKVNNSRPLLSKIFWRTRTIFHQIFSFRCLSFSSFEQKIF